MTMVPLRTESPIGKVAEAAGWRSITVIVTLAMLLPPMNCFALSKKPIDRAT